MNVMAYAVIYLLNSLLLRAPWKAHKVMTAHGNKHIGVMMFNF